MRFVGGTAIILPPLSSLTGRSTDFYALTGFTTAVLLLAC